MEELTVNSEELDELFTCTTKMSVVDYEKELMGKQTQLLHQLKDPIIYRDFMEFMSFSKSSQFVFTLNLVYTFLFPFPILLNIVFGSKRAVFLSVIELLMITIAIVAGWLLYGCTEMNAFIQRNCKFLLRIFGEKTWDKLSNKLQAILYLSLVLSMGLVMIHRTWIGGCETTEYLHSWSCNPNAAKNDVPLDSAAILMIIPLIFTCVMRETRVLVTLTAWSIVTFCLIFCCVLLQSTRSFVMITFYSIVSIVIMFDSFKQYLLFYLMCRQLKKTIDTNHKLAEQNKATEMRHMIANVAHDLKTPLSSFMTGIDLIAAEVSDLTHKLDTVSSIPRESQQEGDISLATLIAFTSGLQSCIMNIRNTNAFMVMTINRCLDYTKASNGLKLVPKHETIELAETLKMPLQCMSNIQQKIKISLLPYREEDICSHIITDKQWLQENVLCLLSNAVKYSAGGEVMIKISRLSQIEGEKLSGSVHRLLPTDKVCGTVEGEVIVTCRDESYDLDRRLSSNGTGDLTNTTSSFVTNHSKKGQRKSSKKIVPVANNIETEAIRRVSVDNASNEELMFEVIDPGIGISEEAMKTLFNPFKQTQRLAGGTGLGLYSLAKRIEALKGKYGVHQRNDGKQGSVFWFTLPYKPDTISAQQVVEASLRGRRGSMVLNNLTVESIKTIIVDRCQSESLRILLAEDTPSIAKMTSMMLRRQKHQTVFAENGQIALELLYHPNPEAGGFDVVLMDLQMPVMDGLEATRRIRAHEREAASRNDSHHHQIVIGVSANSDHETMEEALKAGIDDFLPKPFSLEAFKEVVKQCRERYCLMAPS